jgi:hypothetical protein
MTAWMLPTLSNTLCHTLCHTHTAPSTHPPRRCCCCPRSPGRQLSLHVHATAAHPHPGPGPRPHSAQHPTQHPTPPYPPACACRDALSSSRSTARDGASFADQSHVPSRLFVNTLPQPSSHRGHTIVHCSICVARWHPSLPHRSTPTSCAAVDPPLLRTR